MPGKEKITDVLSHLFGSSDQPPLLKASARELPAVERGWISQAIVAYNNDEYLQRGAGFAPEVHATFIGFHVDRILRKAFPVYRTDNGVFGVNHIVSERTTQVFAVNPNHVYAIEFFSGYLSM